MVKIAPVHEFYVSGLVIHSYPIYNILQLGSNMFLPQVLTTAWAILGWSRMGADPVTEFAWLGITKGVIQL